MPKIILDAAMTIDGFWTDATGKSVFPIKELHKFDLLRPLIARTGAVIWSQRSFEEADDPDWYACNYEYQTPIIVMMKEPVRRPKEDCGLRFIFVDDFTGALAAADQVSPERDIMIIGEAGIAQIALSSGQVDEFYLRIVQSIIGQGCPLLRSELGAFDFRLQGLERTDSTTHLHLVRYDPS